MTVTTRTGANIPSQNVLQNRTYVDGRETHNLVEVGALEPEAADLFERTDGVLANNPVDGRVQIDEMLHMETPTQQEALFPDERQLLPQLWRFMEWRPGQAAGNLPTLPGALAVNETLTLPQGIDFNAQFPIADLSAPIQKAAKRVQLVANGDTNATTISLTDITAVEADPARFTAGDLAKLKTARTEIEDALRGQAQPTLSAQVQLPQLGEQQFVVPNTGSAAIRVTTNTRLTEQQSSSHRNRQQTFSARATLERRSVLEFEIPANHKGILINTDTSEESVLQEGVTGRTMPAGPYRLELYADDGTRVENIDVELPDVPRRENLSMDRYFGWDKTDHNGQTLDRVTTSARTTSQATTATFEYGVPAPAGIDAATANRTAPPAIPLAPGSYRVNMGAYGAADVHVINSRLLVADLEGQRYTFKPVSTSSGVWYETTDNTQNRRVAYNMRDKTFVVANRQGGRDRDYVQTPIGANDRVA